MAFVTLSSKGQVVIRKDIRKRLGLAPGTRFIELVQGENVVLKPVKSTSELFGVLKNSESFKDKSTEEIQKEIDEGWT
ncbi:MAG: AbrB/MazE/SpoVT family DNA-binding domain-containing protein [Candidatus Altiarchaeota archaeon]